MNILKFGGTSLKDAQQIKRVVSIIRAQERPGVVVVSAFGGVTDCLLQAAQKAAAGDASYSELEKKLEERHLETVRRLMPGAQQSAVISQMLLMLNDLHDLLHGVFLLRELTARVADYVMSFGERLSAFVISEILKQNNVPALFVDARKLIKTNERFGRAQILYEPTFAAIRQFFAGMNAIPVVTGFIASTLKGETTTLGRSGSDFTASVFGAALGAKEIQIWTDVDGVLTADPQLVPQAFTIPGLTYEEAMELSHFGAQVVHPATMQPALEAHIPIRIKNTFNPDHPGTLIGQESPAWPYPVKSLSSVKEITLISVIGSGMLGETGIAGRIFSTLAREAINIILITQASSEHSVCFAVAPSCARRARQALTKEFRLELMEKRVNRIQIEEGLAIIAVVGENMRRTPGIAGQVFQALGERRINITAIAQGSSELNISLVVAREQLKEALQVVHQRFFGKATEAKSCKNEE